MRIAIPQFVRFGIVGVANTLVDWGILNLLIFASSRHSLTLYVLFKGISFSVAVANSYVFNRLWVFPRQGTREAKRELFTFFAVSAVGLFVNVFVASSFVRFAPCGARFVLCANAGAVAGTAAAFLWNYFGYKRLVFTTI